MITSYRGYFWIGIHGIEEHVYVEINDDEWIDVAARKIITKTLLSFTTSSLISTKRNLSLNQMKMIGWMKMRNNYNAQ